MEVKEASDLVKKLKGEGRTFTVIGDKFVAVSPTQGLAASDMMKIVRLNKRGHFIRFLKDIGEV